MLLSQSGMLNAGTCLGLACHLDVKPDQLLTESLTAKSPPWVNPVYALEYPKINEFRSVRHFIVGNCFDVTWFGPSNIFMLTFLFQHDDLSLQRVEMSPKSFRRADSENIYQWYRHCRSLRQHTYTLAVIARGWGPPFTIEKVAVSTDTGTTWIDKKLTSEGTQILIGEWKTVFQ